MSDSTTNSILLARRWVLGSQLGQGGLWTCARGRRRRWPPGSSEVDSQDPGCDRELLFEDLTGVRYVVPVIDSREHGENWVLIMPRAVTSLRAHLTERGPLPAEDVVAILMDICATLADLQGRVVHRDIKPENVLVLDGHWCLSDFGIARYAEASTAPDTHKWAWTPAYNPPERWRGERATAASDIYSLGVMAYELLAGRCPFPGPDFRTQHLTSEPPPLTGSPALLAGLVSECLFKAAEVRPTAANIIARLTRILTPPSPAAGQLQAANKEQVSRLAAHAARESAARSAAERRHEIIASATKALAVVGQRLEQAIRDNAPSVSWQPPSHRNHLGWSANLGQATLSLSSVQESPEYPWARGWEVRFEVIAHAEIGVRIPPDRFGYEGRSHSLWFCDAQQPGVFRWYETAFMYAFVPKTGRQDPFALPPGDESGKALAPGMAEFQVAWPFTPIEPGIDDDFLERRTGGAPLRHGFNRVGDSASRDRTVGDHLHQSF